MRLLQTTEAAGVADHCGSAAGTGAAAVHRLVDDVSRPEEAAGEV